MRGETREVVFAQALQSTDYVHVDGLISELSTCGISHRSVSSTITSCLCQQHRYLHLEDYLTVELKDHLDIDKECWTLAVRSNILACRFARCSDQIKITHFNAYCQRFYTSSVWFNFTEKSGALKVQYIIIFGRC